MTARTPVFDAVVLAGGSGRRLGGVVKADLRLGADRLLDLVLDATVGARRVVVAGRVAVTGEVLVPDGVLVTAEDPPGQGPAAGLAAGLDALAAADGPGPAPWVLALACDLPAATDAVGPLVAAAATAAPHTDGVCLVDEQGHQQWLAALYRTGRLRRALTSLGPLDGTPLRAVARRLRLHDVREVPERAWSDIDTWSDLERWRQLDL